MNEQLIAIASQYCPDQTITDITPLSNGLINSTFLVNADNFRFVLQRINSHVFPQPEEILENLQCINRHLLNSNTAQLTIPALLKTATDTNFIIDRKGECWRALQLIENSESRESITRISEAEQTGFALAHFHRLFNDLNPATLHDTLPSFHITPQYLRLYHLAISNSSLVREDRDFSYCRRFIETFQYKADVLEKAKQQGLLRQRIIHGDPKLNNFLFAENSDTIISLIDLDTVKPGLIHYDIGDCLRSCCHIKEDNRFDLDICAAILQRYLQEAGDFLNEADYNYLYNAIELIPFELGLRFFTDFLNGNQYFKVAFPEQNLHRAIAQFELSANISTQCKSIQYLIEQLKPNRSFKNPHQTFE